MLTEGTQLPGQLALASQQSGEAAFQASLEILVGQNPRFLKLALEGPNLPIHELGFHTTQHGFRGEGRIQLVPAGDLSFQAADEGEQLGGQGVLIPLGVQERLKDRSAF